MPRLWSAVAFLCAVLLAGCSSRAAPGSSDAGSVIADGARCSSCDQMLLPADKQPTQWSCKTVFGRRICSTPRGLPPGGSDWRCQGGLAPATEWSCQGKASAAPTGGGWSCNHQAVHGLWLCSRPVGLEDQPAEGRYWGCWKSSKIGGTMCEELDGPPDPHPWFMNSETCLPGQRMWCDGTVYGEWAQVDCDPKTRRWRRKLDPDGHHVIDCSVEVAGLPNTFCACYHFFFNPACCERPDCGVPPGSSDAVCEPSQGGLCSYCNPQRSDCTEAGARCIVTNSHETFCGRLCSTTEPCPDKYQCMTVKLGGGMTTLQCVPSDYSCYY